MRQRIELHTGRLVVSGTAFCESRSGEFGRVKCGRRQPVHGPVPEADHIRAPALVVSWVPQRQT
jgi:hypothetical protein